MRYRAWALLGAMVGVLVTTQARAQCTKDTDCKGDRICDDSGKCVAPPAAAVATPPATAAAPTEPAPSGAPSAQLAPAFANEPAEPAPIPSYSRHRRSPGLMTAGIIMTSAALPFGLFGAYLSDESYRECRNDLPSSQLGTSAQASHDSDCHNKREARNYAIAIVAIGMLAVGIPLIVYGAKKVPNETQATLTTWASPRAGGAKLQVVF